ncbi:hypothetical protein EJ04DRAFT_601322 [Polyplosphaeria fusca]|uniref:Uncharacterized protein n=1 Tax=Polyplosphaeria fusca TaxID=682080 RepID=A0A9P4V3H5_9PLEO|nr:hypothetical protein EJ04DRAFT_601322 [Polyplosphaeria fusca]
MPRPQTTAGVGKDGDFDFRPGRQARGVLAQTKPVQYAGYTLPPGYLHIRNLTASNPHQYTLPPTVLSPFSPFKAPSLESKQAIEDFEKRYPGNLKTIGVWTRNSKDRAENFGENFRNNLPNPRPRLRALPFFVTRMLLPNLIDENRNMLRQLYSKNRSLKASLVLRYDYAREAWARTS